MTCVNQQRCFSWLFSNCFVFVHKKTTNILGVGEHCFTLTIHFKMNIPTINLMSDLEFELPTISFLHFIKCESNATLPFLIKTMKKTAKVAARSS